MKLTIRKNRLSMYEFWFLIAFSLEMLIQQFRLTTIPYMVDFINVHTFLQCIRCINYMIIVLKIFSEKVEVHEFFKISILIIILGLNFYSSPKTLLLTFLFVIGVRNVCFDKIIIPLFVLLSISFSSIIIGSQMDFIDNWQYTQGERERYSLGFTYPSHPTSILFYLVILFCYIKKDRLKWWHVLCIEFLNYWQYQMTNTRTGSTFIGVLVIIFFIIKYLNKNIIWQIIFPILKLSFPACAIMSLLSGYLYKNVPILLKLNIFLNSRISLIYEGLQNYKIKLWGQHIEWIGNGGVGYIIDSVDEIYNFIDCSYVKLLLDAGIILWAIIIYGYTLAVVNSVKKNNIYMAISLSFIAVYCMIEPRLMESGFNPFIPILGCMLYKSNSFQPMLSNIHHV